MVDFIGMQNIFDSDTRSHSFHSCTQPGQTQKVIVLMGSSDQL